MKREACRPFAFLALRVILVTVSKTEVEWIISVQHDILGKNAKRRDI
jgi:hypothetical protein